MSRVLVVVHERATDDVVHGLMTTHGSDDEFVVVAPVPLRGLGYVTNDDRAARRAAAERLESWVDALAVRGVPAHGMLGDSNPRRAVDDALALFRPDEVVLDAAGSALR